MSRVEDRLQTLGLTLPKPLDTGSLPFVLVRMYGDRAYIAGHVPTDPAGKIVPPLGKVGGEVSLEQGQDAAKRCALGMMASLKQALGDLDRVVRWLRVFGMVNAAPGFTQIPQVINGASNIILEVFGNDIGKHARSAVGMAELPMGVPVEVEGEIAFM